MEDKDIPTTHLNPWHPITDPVDLKYLGKLAEEVNELGSAIARCIIQGVDEREPVTGKLNRHWLEDKFADVLVGCTLVGNRFNLDQSRIEERGRRKIEALKKWHDMA